MGNDDSGFPILSKHEDDNQKMTGYIGANELEHALSDNLLIFLLVCV